MNKKKAAFIGVGILILILVGGIVAGFVIMTRQMKEITNQLVYLQDTSDIIQSDLGGLQSDIKKTLEEENSMVENYSIEVLDTDFSAGTYTVQVEVIPKEYTDQTKASVFFGTKEYPLTLEGYTYQGKVVLSTKESYDGNVTFLFRNGEKKSTEVLKNYVGFLTGFDNVLQGTLEKNPEFSQGTMQLNSQLEFDLQGAGNFEFSSLMCVVEKGEETIYEKELLTEKPEEEPDTVDFFQGMSDSDETVSTEAAAEKEVPVEPVAGLVGTVMIEAEQEVEPVTDVRIYLKAVSTDGYTFIYDIFQGTTGEEEGFTEESLLTVPSFYVQDKKGGTLMLN